MYKKLKLNECVRLINPGECVLLTANNTAAKDITPIAWNMPVNDEPPIVAIALDSNHFITGLILESKEFCINIPDISMLDTVIKTGGISGRTGDKFETFGIGHEMCEAVKSIRMKDCAGYLECSFKDTYKYSGVDLIVADVVAASVKEELYDDSWKTDKFKSIHSVGNMYGASLGERFKF